MPQKFFLLFCFSLLALYACDPDNPLNPDPGNSLPPLTMEGKNTFGCLVNGEVWNAYVEQDVFGAQKINAQYEILPDWEAFGISATKNIESENIYQVFILDIFYPKVGENSIVFDTRVFTDFGNCGDYHLDTLSTHTMTITKLDNIDFIVSGTFEFTVVNHDCPDTLRITDGRFDVYAKP